MTNLEESSPIKRIRKELGMTMYQFAAATSSNDNTIQKLQNGASHVIPEKILQYLAMKGYSPAAISDEYAAFRKTLQAA